jgi:hypothetical protein
MTYLLLARLLSIISKIIVIETNNIGLTGFLCNECGGPYASNYGRPCLCVTFDCLGLNLFKLALQTSDYNTFMKRSAFMATSTPHNLLDELYRTALCFNYILIE